MSAYGLVVIGGGEAGISAALRAAQLGAKVCLINREPELGGGCVQTGTLPSKTLSNAAHFLENLKKGKRYGIPVVEGAKADYKTILESRHKTTMCEVGILATLIRKNAIETLIGTASFKGPRSVELRLLDGTVRALDSPKTVVATGSRPVALPGLPFDGKTVLSPDDLTALDAVPGRFLIVGAGVIGCEMAFIFRSLGSEVVVVEKAERALLGQDHDVAALITREFKKRGIRLLVQTGLERVETGADGRVRAFLSSGETVEADRVMVGIGRRPSTEELNLAAAGITPGPRGEIQVDERMETTVPGIYAAGDVLARFMLSSMAVVEARIAAENALGRAVKMDYTCAPWGIYTDPEVGSVGLTEEWARAGGDVVIGQCGYNDLVRSCLDGNVTGFFKLIFDGPTRRLVGAHVAGQDASEIIHFAALAVKMGARAEDLKDMVYNHPTVSEGFGKAAADALNKFGQRTPA
ncbi:MAG: NAD(P)/FAD-dependent oxidoreductase [Candidatus Aminicenantes bacterium]|nr:NAD(P)/FAD-dependent oxidoreductase [Candidatus Aminicenantes bacterium]